MPLRIIAASVLALGIACAPHPLRFGPDGEINDAALLLRKLDERSARVLSVKAEARVKIRAPERSGTVGELIAAARPAALHLETLDFFGKPVALLASDGERFAMFAQDKASFYTGPATAQNISRLLPLVLEPSEVAAILLGDIPRIRATEARLELDTEARAYRVTLKAGAVSQRLWVSTEDLALLRSEVRGARAYDLRHDDFETLSGLPFPKTIELTTVRADGSSAGVEIAVRYKELELNPPLDPSFFKLEQPAGSKLIEVDTAGRERHP
jgi:outer membrane lipoprotein-sorting protein